MITIYKFEIPPHDKFILNLSENWQFLSLQIQNDIPVMWFKVNTDEQLLPFNFSIYGTGQPTELNEKSFHLGTFQKNGFVWHVFYENTSIISGKAGDGIGRGGRSSFYKAVRI